jgi:BRCA1-associated protein
MPSYFYHLKFELYPYPSSTNKHQERDIWLPPPGSNIFSGDSGTWPSHKPVEFEAQLRQRLKSHSSSAKQKQDSIIDCGPARASNHSPDDSTELRTVSADKELEFPPPVPGVVHRDLETAEKDWRFGRVRVESLDMERPRRERGESSANVPQRPGYERGESISALDGINAGLTAGGVGRVTKARYEGLEGKNTEVGWGIVHLYRDGEETPGLGVGMDVYTGEEGENGEKEGEDCTTLCIPAVPSYLTPSDFLGFVGEKTREMVSHFRMVMTGRMNRYLVLMKFRDSDDARKWKAEWDGKVFNSMEVSSFYCSKTLEKLC